MNKGARFREPIHFNQKKYVSHLCKAIDELSGPKEGYFFGSI